SVATDRCRKIDRLRPGADCDGIESGLRIAAERGRKWPGLCDEAKCARVLRVSAGCPANRGSPHKIGLSALAKCAGRSAICLSVLPDGSRVALPGTRRPGQRAGAECGRP